MEMGCVPKKNNDGSISLLPPSKPKEEPQLSLENNANRKIVRSHSSPDFFKAGPLPPLSQLEDHFSVPQSSLDIRKSKK